MCRKPAPHGSARTSVPAGLCVAVPLKSIHPSHPTTLATHHTAQLHITYKLHNTPTSTTITTTTHPPRPTKINSLHTCDFDSERLVVF